MRDESPDEANPSAGEGPPPERGRTSSLDALDLQRYFFDGIWHNSPDNLFIVAVTPDQEFLVEAVNPAHEGCFDIPNDRLRGRRVQDVIPAPYAENVIRRYRECVAAGKPISYVETGSLVDGHPLTFHTQLIPIRDGAGRTNRIFGISRDITWLTAAEHDLRQAKLSLEQVVATRTLELQQANAALQELAIRDSLTGAYNRRHFFELAEREYQLARRHHLPLSAMMIDADRFKRINDKFGHAWGDAALSSIAGSCMAILRESDIMGRYGGEEFAVVLPSTGIPDAYIVAERIRDAVARKPVNCGTVSISLTVSIGVAELHEDQPNFNGLLHEADMALLAAKQRGRNRVEAC